MVGATRTLLATAIAVGVIAVVTLDPTPATDGNSLRQMALAAVDLPIEGRAPSLRGATGWLNSQPLTDADLRGKVVLFNFWTYTCINWMRQSPYLSAWAEKYRDRGLVVIGVHTPEFGFEASVDNVRRAVSGFGINYPIAIDSDYAVWRAFNNRAWPALFLSMRRAASAIIFLGRANTNNRKELFSSCWSKREWAVSIKSWCRSTPRARKRKPIGASCGLLKRTPATRAL